MPDRYQNRHIQNLFNISAPTVRTWADEFSEFLSPSANPPPNKTRYFTEEDVRVFATISRMRDEKESLDNIRQSLEAGVRDNLPVDVPKELIDITASEMGLKLFSEIADMRQEIEALKKGSDKERELRDEIARLNKQIGRLELLLEIEREKNKKNE